MNKLEQDVLEAISCAPHIEQVHRLRVKGRDVYFDSGGIWVSGKTFPYSPSVSSADFIAAARHRRRELLKQEEERLACLSQQGLDAVLAQVTEA